MNNDYLLLDAAPREDLTDNDLIERGKLMFTAFLRAGRNTNDAEKIAIGQEGLRLCKALKERIEKDE